MDAGLPQIVPPIQIKPSQNYMLVIKDATGTYHYFDEHGNYDGDSKDPIIPIEDNPN